MGKRGPAPRKGAPTTIRFKPAVRQRLEAAAQKAGRSLSDEIAGRLEWSFDLERRFGDAETLALCELIAIAFRDVGRYAGRPWFEHPWSFDQAGIALRELFGYFRPPDVVPNSPLDVARPHPLEDAHTTEAAKATLRNFNLGQWAAHGAINRLEASAEHQDLIDGAQLRAIAARLKDRLVAAGMAGEAARELQALDDERKEST